MAFATLKDYNLTFPVFKYPELSNVFQQVAEAYRSNRSGENIAAGISSAGKSIGGAISGIPKEQQDASLNAAKVANLKADTDATAQGKLIAAAPMAVAVAPGDLGYVQTAPAQQTGPLTATSADLSSPVTNNANLAGTNTMPPEDLSDMPPLPDELPDLLNEGPDALTGGDVGRTGVVQPAQARTGLDTPNIPPNTANSGLVTKPLVGVQTGLVPETLHGGTVIQKLNGVPVLIKEPSDTKMRPLSKVEGEVLNPAAAKQSATIKAMAIRNGVDLPSYTDEERMIAAQNREAKATEAAARQDRVAQGDTRLDLRKQQLGLGQERFLNTPATGTAAKAFETTASNFASANENAKIDPKARTGADDVMLLQAIASIEQPNRSGTGHDLEMTLKAMPIGSKLGVQWDRIKGIVDNHEPANSRILDDQTVASLVKAGQSAYDSKLDTYAKHAMPFLKEAEKIGVPSMIHPDVAARIKQMDNAAPAAQKPTSAPANANAPTPVGTQAEYDALPSGAFYVDSKGITRKKK